MKTIYTLILGTLITLTTVVTGCGNPAESEASNQAAVSVGVSCGGKTCSREESCCDGPKGARCTTTACLDDEERIAAPVGEKCGKETCSREESCCDGPQGPYCTTTACKNE